MAGVKGRSGGARPNSGGPRANSGGARPGAGRKKKPENEGKQFLPGSDPEATPLDVLQQTMRDPDVPLALRIAAARAAAPFVHQKMGEGGKKEEKSTAAKKAAKGRFSPSAPPKLVVNNT